MRTRVLILGAGYAGVSFLQGMRRSGLTNLEYTLVDRNPYHTLLTETHTVASGGSRAARVEIPLSALGSGVRILTASVKGIDPERRLVNTDHEVLPYDFLIFSLGGVENDFGIPGVHEHALALRGLKEAERIRERLMGLPEGSGVVIVGGGLTGVELAAELALTLRHRRSVTLVEGHAQVLPGLPAGLQERARRRLGWLGANVITGAQASRVEKGTVCLADGTVLKAGLVVWAAGVKGHPLASELDLPLDRTGRVPVDTHLRSARAEIYVIGDSAAFRAHPAGTALPPSAQLASQMGFAAAKDLAVRLKGRPGFPFVPRLRGVLCDLGGLNATGLVHRFQIAGMAAYLAKRASVLQYLWQTTGQKGLMIHLRETLAEMARQPGPVRVPR